MENTKNAPASAGHTRPMGYVATANDPTKNMNDDTKHTPGPWTYAVADHDHTEYEHAFDILSEHRPYVATVLGGADPGRSEANARLIAAAPELLGALQVLYACWVDEVVRNGGIRDKHHSINEEVIAAIEKATRPQPHSDNQIQEGEASPGMLG